MSEKILHQITIVETDDGYRIEIKGDKEKLRAMGFGRGFGGFGGFGPGMMFRGMRPGFGGRPGPHGFHGHHGHHGDHGDFGRRGPGGWGRRGWGPQWIQDDVEQTPEQENV
ncbi:MAG TPA: hypothetical protein VLQ48_12825 [Chloroflexia bacterium]|nr:hypothetical protein [Chloroflexia bacterium]